MTDIGRKRSCIRGLSLIVMMFFSIMSLGALESFYEEYSESERLVIAGAYLAVAEQYAELGESRKAEDYKKMADNIFPGIDMAKLAETVVEQETEKVEALLPVRPSGKEASAVRYYTTKLLRAVFTEDIQDVESLLSSRLYLPGYEEGVEKDYVMAYVKKAFDTYELDRIDPASLYNVDRLYIKSEGSAWTAALELNEYGEKVFTEELGFPGSTHIFYFREYREGWRLIAIDAK